MSVKDFEEWKSFWFFDTRSNIHNFDFNFRELFLLKKLILFKLAYFDDILRKFINKQELSVPREIGWFNILYFGRFFIRRGKAHFIWRRVFSVGFIKFWRWAVDISFFVFVEKEFNLIRVCAHLFLLIRLIELAVSLLSSQK